MAQTPYKIEKLKVLAFKKPERSGASESFEFLFNPETISSVHSNQFASKKSINSSGRSSPYALSSTDKLQLDLILDKTINREHLPGPVANSDLSVRQQVDAFLGACFYKDGDLHEPRFLKVEWGSLSFECKLKEVEVSFSVFNADGEPLRAKLSTTFFEDMPKEKSDRKDDQKSPDITHRRLLLQDQTITGLTREVYGDATHYLVVAKANRLNHFRKLKPGTTLHFPPLEK